MGFPHSSVGKESTCNAEDPSSLPGSRRSAGEGIGYPLQYSWSSLVTQIVKNQPAMQKKWSESRSVTSDSLQAHGLYIPWNSLGQNTGVDNLSLHQGIFLTQGLNPGLPHCRQTLYCLSHQGSPISKKHWPISLPLTDVPVMLIGTMQNI